MAAMYPGLRVQSAWLQPVVNALNEKYPEISQNKAVDQARALIKDTRSGFNTHEEWKDWWTRGVPPFGVHSLHESLLLPGQQATSILPGKLTLVRKQSGGIIK